MSLFASLSAASNALAAFQSALTVTQNNVNNASTPGYVTQTATFKADSFVPGTGEAGGVEAGPVISSRDQFAEQSVQSATSQLGNFQQQVESLTSLQSQFDISGNSGIPAAFNGLTSAFSNWSALPNDSTARQGVITSAQSAAAAFQQSASNISQVAQSADTQTVSLVNQVNTLAAQLAGYNAQILSGGQNDSGLDASVNSTIESLSQLANVATMKQPDGTTTVILGGQTDLVSGQTVNKLATPLNPPALGLSVSSGGPVGVPMAITPGVNDTLNLKVDGTALPAITLDPTNTSLAAVTADINKQLTAAGSTAVASTDTQGRLEITSGSTGAGASVQVLAGSGNSTLGLSTSVPPQARVVDSNGNDVTGSITGGQLGGNLAVRNQDIPAIQGDPNQTGSLNQLAKAFADRVNAALGTPLFTYDNTSATNIANSLKVNSSVTAQQLPNTQAITVWGTPVASAIVITPGVNDTLNLNVDGTAWPTITLSPADTNAASVAGDLNAQFKTLGIGASAAVYPSTGGLYISTTNTAPTASIQVLPGKANATLGLANTSKTQGAVNGVALSLSALSNPSSAADEINGQSYTQFFGSIAAQVGSQLSLAQNGQTLQQDVVTQAQSLRQQVSGVDLNTEATQLLQLQSSYQAASKMMTVIDNLIQAVIGLITPGSAVS